MTEVILLFKVGAHVDSALVLHRRSFLPDSTIKIDIRLGHFNLKCPLPINSFK